MAQKRKLAAFPLLPLDLLDAIVFTFNGYVQQTDKERLYKNKNKILICISSNNFVQRAVTFDVRIRIFIARFFFYKQHFYKQHKAEICPFWNTNSGKYWDLDYDTISKSLYSFQHLNTFLSERVGLFSENFA